MASKLAPNNREASRIEIEPKTPNGVKDLTGSARVATKKIDNNNFIRAADIMF